MKTLQTPKNSKFRRSSRGLLLLSAIVASAAFLPQAGASVLNSADTFAVLANTTVTSIGTTVLNGNLGVTPGTSITGFPPGTVVNGTTYTGANAVVVQALADANSAYTTLAGETPTANLSGQDLGGQTLTNGVYKFDSSAGLTGALILDGLGNTNSQFVFQINSTFISGSDASIVLENGASASNIFWQVGSSATFGTTSSLQGSFLADQSITFNTGSTLVGSAIALNAAVTLDNNTVTAVPEPKSYALFGLGALVLVALYRRKTAE
jgi:hypothetical protein